MQVWKRWYERQGWKVRTLGYGNEGYIALRPGCSPETPMTDLHARHAIGYVGEAPKVPKNRPERSKGEVIPIRHRRGTEARR